jgi:DNA-binding response OmpR family regulator
MFDLVLLDLGLCDGDGDQLLQRIRNASPRAGAPRSICAGPDDACAHHDGADQGQGDRISGLDL